jgi:hypothetical protein
MAYEWQESRSAFAEAAGWFVQTVALVVGRWDGPGLGEWDVRALVGHTSRSLLTVETYLSRPAATIEIPSAADYFRVTRAIAAAPAVAERGREAGAALGPDPVAAVAEIAVRVLPLLDDRSGEETVTTIAGGMRLSDYLPTRTFELVVHTADLASAIGAPLNPPPTPAMHALQLVAHLAVDNGVAGTLLLASTGRGDLPSGFSIL